MIGFSGLSHLGIVSSLATAAQGFQVVAYDSDPEVVRRLSKGDFPVFEAGLAELFAAHRERITYTSRLEDLGACSVNYISRDVPTSEANVSDTSFVEVLFDSVLSVAGEGTSIVILSQVPPGYVRALAARSEEHRAARGISLFYQVETLVFGIAVERALKPERIIIGAPAAARPEGEYQNLLESFRCPLLVMRYESAELAKISINICLISSVTVANVLSELCESVGADWTEIEAALRLDRRIGQYAYLSPGLGIAGGNLERDLITLTQKLEATGGHVDVVKAWQRDLRYRSDWVLRRLHRELGEEKQGAAIAILGLAYKPGTHSTKNSPALRLLSGLRGFTLKLYDPQVTLTDLPPGATQHGSALEAITDVDAVAVMTAWPEFKQLNAARMSGKMRGKLIIDPLRALDFAEESQEVSYFVLGR